MNKKSQIIPLILILILSTGFTKKTLEPNQVYRVYLEGKSLGLVESKEELEEYINNQQEKIKDKYDVKKVYVPKDLDIEREITYKNDISTIEQIYKKIEKNSSFTIDGYTVSVEGIEYKNETGETIKPKNQNIYILDKNVFTESMGEIINSFISEQDYKEYEENKQIEIDKTGKIVENIYIDNSVVIKKEKIPTNEKIYTDKSELSKYLLFGTTKTQQKYIVQEGDNIADIAYNNKMSTDEFLVANPEFQNENSLLYPGQEVILGILNPQVSIVQENHVVELQETYYKTETRFDDTKYEGTKEVIQAGVNGTALVAQKHQIVNGKTTNIVTVSTEEVTPMTLEIVVEGTKKKVAGFSGPYITVPTKGNWAWPANCSSISSGYGYRWGGFHDAIDINGCGHGSPIYAAQSGIVTEASKRWPDGNYIVIDHLNGYFTIYAHLSQRYIGVGTQVSKGQVIGGMGDTGNVTGVHLHFGTFKGPPYKGGVHFNPMLLY